MDNEYDIFEDLKGRVMSMTNRSFDDAEDFEFFLETANLITQIEEELKGLRDRNERWQKRALEYFQEKNELKKKFEEVEETLNK